MPFRSDRARTALAVALPLAALATLPAAAQTQPPKTAKPDSKIKLTLDASARLRFEELSGQFRPGLPADDTFLSMRTIVAAKLGLGPVTIAGELVDSRGYIESGRSSVRTSEINDLEPAQAYVSVDTGRFGSITAGKFSMDIGGQRLVARTDFPNGVQSYLGVMTDWRDKAKNRLTLFWTRPFAALPEAPQDIYDNKVELDRAATNTVFFGGSGTLAQAFGKTGVELFAYRLAEQDRTTHPTRNRHLVTFGTRIRRAPAKASLDYEFEGALQRGTARATAAASDRRDLDVHAGFAHAEFGYSFPKGWKPRISAMFDYASGDSADPNTYNRFDTLFGSRRADFGPLSLFGPVSRANLVSPGMRIEAKASPRFDVMAAVRGLWLADKTDSFGVTGVRDRNGRAGDFAGVQAELRARRWLKPSKIKLEAGAAYLGRGRFLRDAPNAAHNGDTVYGYTDLTISF